MKKMQLFGLDGIAYGIVTYNLSHVRSCFDAPLRGYETRHAKWRHIALALQTGDKDILKLLVKWLPSGTPSPQDLADLHGLSPDDYPAHLASLKRAGVFLMSPILKDAEKLFGSRASPLLKIDADGTLVDPRVTAFPPETIAALRALNKNDGITAALYGEYVSDLLLDIRAVNPMPTFALYVEGKMTDQDIMQKLRDSGLFARPNGHLKKLDSLSGEPLPLGIGRTIQTDRFMMMVSDSYCNGYLAVARRAKDVSPVQFISALSRHESRNINVDHVFTDGDIFYGCADADKRRQVKLLEEDKTANEVRLYLLKNYYRPSVSFSDAAEKLIQMETRRRERHVQDWINKNL